MSCRLFDIAKHKDLFYTVIYNYIEFNCKFEPVYTAYIFTVEYWWETAGYINCITYQLSNANVA